MFVKLTAAGRQSDEQQQQQQCHDLWWECLSLIVPLSPPDDNEEN